MRHRENRPTNDATPDRRSPDPKALSRRAFLVAGGAAGAAAAVPLLLRGGDAASSAGGVAPSSAVTSSTASGAATAVTPSTAVASTTTTTVVPPSVEALGNISTDHLTITVANGYRTITTASMPDHDIDANFRYPGTPSEQQLSFTVPVSPQMASSPTFVRTGQLVGVHLDSVVFDPKTAGYYDNDMSGGWNYTADRLDVYGAHTRPDGYYHYHVVTDRWAADSSTHSPIVAWAADGFPMYLRYGYADANDAASGVKELRSSYRLKSGARPTGAGNPGGSYDGTYVADYEHVAGAGDLDECNRCWCVTPEFPTGTYAYFLTSAWPYVPNYLRGTPDRSFAPGGGNNGTGGNNGPGGQRRTR